MKERRFKVYDEKNKRWFLAKENKNGIFIVKKNK